MTKFKTMSEWDVLQYAVIGMLHKVSDLELAQRQNPADAEVYDEIIADCDNKMQEIFDRMDALEKEEERA